MTGADIHPVPPPGALVGNAPRTAASAGADPAACHSVAGRRWHIRRLRPLDAVRLAACFERMSATARMARFFAAKRQLTESELKHLCSPDGWEHMALGAFAVDDRGREQELLGAVRCLRLPERRDTADLGIAVADDARGLGLGRELLTALSRHAKVRGIRTLHCDVLARNRPMHALAEAFGAERVGGDAGTVSYHIPLMPAQPAGGPWMDWGDLPLPPQMLPEWLLPDPLAAQRDWYQLLDHTAALWLPGAWGEANAAAGA